MIQNLQSYLTTVLNERMWHLGGQNILRPSYIFSGGRTPESPWSTPPDEERWTSNEIKRLDVALHCRTNSALAITLGLLTLIGFILFILTAAAIFHSLEDWTFGEALYCCFITVLTIGYADFVPGTYTRHILWRQIQSFCLTLCAL